MNKNNSGYKTHSVLRTRTHRLLQEISPFLRFLLLETQTKEYKTQLRPSHAPWPLNSTSASIAELLGNLQANYYLFLIFRNQKDNLYLSQ